MPTCSMSKRKGYLVAGATGLCVALAYLGMALQLPFGRLDQPGAAVFPVLVGVLVAITSLMAMLEGRRMPAADCVELPAGADRVRLLGLLGLMLGYFLILPWLGQITSSALFCAFLLRLLSDMSWSRTIVYACSMSLSLYAVFVLLLKVPMPRGVVGF